MRTVVLILIGRTAAGFGGAFVMRAAGGAGLTNRDFNVRTHSSMASACGADGASNAHPSTTLT